MSILVLTTGGTIGALPYENLKHPPAFSSMPGDGTDFIRGALVDHFGWARGRCVSLEPRDSKNIDDAYLENMMCIMQDAVETKILVTYGTDRILRGAEYFYNQHNNPELKNKTILLTGAMIPLANGSESDGFQNLEFSLRQLGRPDIEAGVFIVLCDHENADDETGVWKPHLYPYQPGVYEKIYRPDARYNRLRRV